jgi:molecular chaperone DnaJ
MNQGFFSTAQVCPVCHGRGVVIPDPCPRCHGGGTEVRRRDVKVKLPVGVKDGQRIKVAKRGAAGRNGGPPGDLYVVVKVRPHPVFGRKGPRDLTVHVPDLEDALIDLLEQPEPDEPRAEVTSDLVGAPK